MIRVVTLAALGLVALCGCASSGEAVSEPAYEKVYRTGSNLPQRDGTGSRTVTAPPESVPRPQPLPRGGS